MGVQMLAPLLSSCMTWLPYVCSLDMSMEMSQGLKVLAAGLTLVTT